MSAGHLLHAPSNRGRAEAGRGEQASGDSGEGGADEGAHAASGLGRAAAQAGKPERVLGSRAGAVVCRLLLAVSAVSGFVPV